MGKRIKSIWNSDVGINSIEKFSVRFAIIIFSFALILMIVGTIFGGSYCAKPTTEAINNFFEIYSGPLKLIAASFALFLVWITSKRMGQTAEQIEQTKTQIGQSKTQIEHIKAQLTLIQSNNNFNMGISHFKLFSELVFDLPFMMYYDNIVLRFQSLIDENPLYIMDSVFEPEKRKFIPYHIYHFFYNTPSPNFSLEFKENVDKLYHQLLKLIDDFLNSFEKEFNLKFSTNSEKIFLMEINRFYINPMIDMITKLAKNNNETIDTDLIKLFCYATIFNSVIIFKNAHPEEVIGEKETQLFNVIKNKIEG